MKIGNTDITGVYLGNTPVTVYIGSTLVFPDTIDTYSEESNLSTDTSDDLIVE